MEQHDSVMDDMKRRMEALEAELSRLREENIELDMLRRRVVQLEREENQVLHALQRSEQVLDSIIHTIPDIVYRLDKEGRIIFISDAVCRYGYDPYALLGQHILELIHVDDREKARYGMTERRTGSRRTMALEVRLAVPQQDQEVHVELIHEQFFSDDAGAREAYGLGPEIPAKKDYTQESTDEPPVFLVEAEGLYRTGAPTADQFLGTQGIARDITQRKRVEEALRLSERELRSIIHSIPDIIYRLDQDGRFTFVSEAARQFGFDPETLLGRSVLDIVHPDDRDRAFYGIRERRTGDRRTRGLELRLVNDHGAPVQFEIQSQGFEWEACFQVEAEGLYSSEDVGPHGFVGTQGIARNIAALRWAEGALRESEERFAQVTANARVFVWEVNSDGVFKYASPMVEVVLGYRAEELVGKMRIWDLLSTERHQDYQDRIRGMCVSGEPISEFIRPAVRRDGRVIWLATSAIPIHSRDGVLVGCRGSDRDVTEHKQAEDNLRRRSTFDDILVQVASRLISLPTNEYEEAMIEAMGMASAFCGADRCYIQIDAADEEGIPAFFLEWRTPGTPSARELASMISEGEMKWTQNYLARGKAVLFREAGELERAGYEEWADMEIHSLVAAPLTLRQHARGFIAFDTLRVRHEWSETHVNLLRLLAGILVSARDRRLAEEELRRLAMAIEQADEGVIVTDANGIIQFVNPAFERITGYAPSEVIGLNPKILRSGKQDDEFYKQMWSKILRGETWRGHIVNQRKDGRLCEEERSIAPIRDAAGRVTQFVSVSRDVTNELSLEAQLRQAQKMEAVGQLAGGVAHDFNNLLQVINGYADIVLMELPDDSPHRDHLEELLKAAERAKKLVRQLLVFSRRDAIQPKLLDLNEVIAELLKMLRRLISEQVELVVRPGVDLAKVNADAGQMEQILINLCVNARDAMPVGGRIVIETQNVYLDETYAHLHSMTGPGWHVMLSVSDTGEGMSADVLEHIFELFFTTKGAERGTGLGLATVYAIVKRHNGLVNVYSEIDRGTVIRLYLPAAGEGIAEPEEGMDERLSTGGAEVLLLAEDDELVCGLTVRLLRNAGYQVLVATDGVEAIDLFNAHMDVIDLALLDVVMPRCGGKAVYDVIQAMRPEIPVLFTSGYSESMIPPDQMPEQCIGMIRKPYGSRTLLSAIRGALDARRSG